MAFPTSAQLNFVATDPIGAQIMNNDTTQKFALGTVCRGVDMGSLQYGAATFIYLKGVASTAAGDLVVFDEVAATTTRAVTTSRGPVAVAMAPTVASQYGWYMIEGQAVVQCTGATSAGATLMIANTGGVITAAGVVSYYLSGCNAKTALNTPTTGFVQAALQRPAVVGFNATGQTP